MQTNQNNAAFCAASHALSLSLSLTHTHTHTYTTQYTQSHISKQKWFNLKKKLNKKALKKSHDL